jgi:hypothetical protein
MRFPRSENLLNSLRKREQGDLLTPQKKSTIIRNLSSNMEARAIIGQAEFDYSIQEAKDKEGNASLNFPLCDLSKITFPPAGDQANETNTTFNRSCFIGASFPDKANLSSLIFENADFSQAKLTDVDLSFSKLQNTNFTEATLTDAKLRWARLNKADLTGADLTGADLSFSKLQNTNFTKAKLKGAYLKGAYLIGTDLTEADLTGTDLTGTDLTGAKLTGADLTGAKLTGAKFANVIQSTITKETDSDFINYGKFCKFLNALDVPQKKEILGIGGASTSIYLKNLLDDAEAKSKKDESKITGINKVLEIVKLFEKELGLNPSTSVRDPRLGLPTDFLRRRPREEGDPQGGR